MSQPRLESMSRENTVPLVDDFHFVRGERLLHVVNAPSPAAISERIVAEPAGMRG